MDGDRMMIGAVFDLMPLAEILWETEHSPRGARFRCNRLAFRPDGRASRIHLDGHGTQGRYQAEETGGHRANGG